MGTSLLANLVVFLVPTGVVAMTWGGVMKKTAGVVTGVLLEVLAGALFIFAN